ncbi:MAG: lycopene cyclase domain-containing protein [Actinomycetota bacterium]|nr:lycopene cyclase domain-containing protein [Actinomycetota bacterium]
MIPAYPGFSVAAVAAVVALELIWLRTGVFRQAAYWVAMLIVFAFQVPVDGWMTKLSDPIVIYNPSVLSGVRFPLDIPTEEFAYAFAMVTLTILLWERAGRSHTAGDAGGGVGEGREAAGRMVP